MLFTKKKKKENGAKRKKEKGTHIYNALIKPVMMVSSGHEELNLLCGWSTK